MISLLITIIIVALVLSLLFWALSFLPIAQPFLNIVKFLIVLVFVLYLLYALMPLAGHPGLLR